MPRQTQRPPSATPYDRPSSQVAGLRALLSRGKGPLPGPVAGANESVAQGRIDAGAGNGRGFPVIDYDAALVDVDRLEELELMVQLMAAATEAPARVPLQVIDRVLGVDPEAR